MTGLNSGRIPGDVSVQQRAVGPRSLRLCLPQILLHLLQAIVYSMVIDLTQAIDLTQWCIKQSSGVNKQIEVDVIERDLLI